jgi:hypothetical protein
LGQVEHLISSIRIKDVHHKVALPPLLPLLLPLLLLLWGGEGRGGDYHVTWPAV